jgi:hypothetical protein
MTNYNAKHFSVNYIHHGKLSNFQFHSVPRAVNVHMMYKPTGNAGRPLRGNTTNAAAFSPWHRTRCSVRKFGAQTQMLHSHFTSSKNNSLTFRCNATCIQSSVLMNSTCHLARITLRILFFCSCCQRRLQILSEPLPVQV